MDVSHFPMPMASTSSSHMRVWERRLLYCVPVPGRNSWTEPSSESLVNRCVDCSSQQREKRRRMDDESVDHMDMLVSDEGFQGSPSTKKMSQERSF
ncbi:mini-chromosome maintenance complex-binding protein-like isoform X2 [Castanea sativa]